MLTYTAQVKTLELRYTRTLCCVSFEIMRSFLEPSKDYDHQVTLRDYSKVAKDLRADQRRHAADSAAAVSADLKPAGWASGLNVAASVEVLASSDVDLNLPEGFEGLAWVARKTTESFSDLAVSYGVTELAINSWVLVLPRLPRIFEGDKHFVPVIALESETNGLKLAFFTLVHPACLKVDWRFSGPQRQDLGKIIVGHVCKRDEDGRSASHPIPERSRSMWDSNTGRRVLDARWGGRQGVGSCKGYCRSVVESVCRDRERMGDIFVFATWGQGGDVVCENATYSSVAAGIILQLFFGREVDFTHAIEQDNRCCRCPAVLHKDALNVELRSLRFNDLILDGYEGLAWVTRKTKQPFSNLASYHGVSELDIGSPVLVLPRLISQFEGDRHFIPVIALDAQKLAFFTYVHPECLEVERRTIGHRRDSVGTIKVGHTCPRNERPASHSIPEYSPVMWDSITGRRVLDARWDGAQGIGNCKGYCLSVVESICGDRKRMGDILIFAAWVEGGDVVCNYATHRSVAAGIVLQIFFGRSVDFSQATANNCPCGCRAALHKVTLNIVLRSLRN